MNCPSFLLDLQKWVGRIITQPLRSLDEKGLPIYEESLSREIALFVSSGPHLTSAQRIGLYNQQYWFRLFIILQEQYPTLVRLFGFGNFNQEIAEPYLLKYPPGHWSLSALGYSLPQWIEENYRAEDYILVYETALVDAAFDKLTASRIAIPLDLRDFAQAKTEKLVLQPFVQVLALHADLFDFRKQMLEQEPAYWLDADFPIIQWKEQQFFVVSSGKGIEEISQDEYLLLKAFQGGSTLQAACAPLSHQAVDSIADWFKQWTQRGWLALYTAPQSYKNYL
jgi:hypothetical protein